MAVNDIPRPRSYVQQLGEMLDSVTSRIGIRRLKVGGPQLSGLEAAAQADVRISNDIFKLLAAADLDNAEGLALDRIGAQEGVPRFTLAPATGVVTVQDVSFTKTASRVFQGTSAPIVGSVSINVESAVGWPSSGSVYLGRGTTNVEGPLNYSSVTPNGSYYTLNLATPTTRFHNKGESVVVAQGGNRVIDPGTVVATAQGALTSAVQFSTVFVATIPDGETEVVGVEVVATSAGNIGNVGAQTIKEFVGGSPFPGASVINTKPFVTGRDTETSNDYRERIRSARNSKQRGTDLAIESAVVGAISAEESKRISSASLVRKTGAPSILYIDDGSGYEEANSGAGIETVVDSASGGEDCFSVLNRPVTKAFLKSRNQAPFALTAGSKLSVSCGGVVTTHTFDPSIFNSIASASAYEVVASINADPALLWGARTSDSGTTVVISGRDESNEDIVVVGVDSPDVDANAALIFPVSKAYTTLLYKNDRLLSKDGKAAVIRSRPFTEWNVFTGNQTLEVAVDSTPLTTYLWNDQDFIDAATGFNSVSKNSLSAWVAVINKKIPGITASIENDHLVLTSNRGRSGDAAVTIGGGTLVSNFVFASGTSKGLSRDYVLDRGTGQIVTAVRLASGDRLTLGSAWTRAFLESDIIGPTTLATDLSMWFVADGSPELPVHGVGGATPLTATVEAVMGYANRIKITATSATGAFVNVAAGDWAIFWDSDSDLPASLRKAWRVIQTEVDAFDLLNSVVIEKRAAAAPRLRGTATALLPSGGLLSKVLLCGGWTASSGVTPWTQRGAVATEHCEIFDPNTGSYTAAAPMSVPRTCHAAALLADGRVFVSGGYNTSGIAVTSTEIYDPVANTWTAGPAMAIGRAEHSATTLGSGRVLIAGGNSGGVATASTTEFNPAGSNYINNSTMGAARYAHGAVLLPAGAGTAGAEAGNVLVCGGIGVADFPLQTCERYSATAPGWIAKASMGTERAYFGFSVASTQVVLACGDSEYTAGIYSNDNRATFQTYNCTTNAWTAATVVETGWRFTDKPQGLVKTPTNNSVIAYGGVYESGGIKSLRHKKFDGIGLTWSTLADSLSAQTAVEKTAVHGVALTGGASPDRVLFYGGFSEGNNVTSTSGNVIATSEVWNDDSTWEYPDDATALLNGTLGSRGLSFVRTANALQKAVVPAAAAYTAPSFISAINDDLEGIVASVYRTSRIRVETTSYGLDDSIVLVASTNATALDLGVGEIETNVVGHFASVEAQNSGLGTPADFIVHAVASQAAPYSNDAVSSLYIPVTATSPFDLTPPMTSEVLGLKRWGDGLNPKFWQSTWTLGQDKSFFEFGNTKNVRSPVATMERQTDRIRFGLRKLPEQDFVTETPFVFAVPYSVGPRDDLTVVVDEDLDTKRFSTQMWRALKPSQTTYSSQVAVRDHDAGDVKLGTTFGISYDFNDFVVYMKSRVKSHSGDAGRSLLWRFWRHGPEGDNVAVRYVYPSAASSSLSISVDHPSFTSRTLVNIVLGSSAAKSGSNVTPTTRIGTSRPFASGTSVYDVYLMTGFTVIQGERTAAGNTTRLRIQVPNDGTVAHGPQGCGLVGGETLWFEAAAPTATTLFSGAFVVSSVGAFNAGTGQQDIFVAPNILHDGTSAWALTPNPGTVSYDLSGEATWDASIITGDLVRLQGTHLPTTYLNTTMRVFSAGRQYLACRALDPSLVGVLTSTSWSQLVNTADVAVFGGPTQTATALAAAVNAMSGDSGSSPVTATVLGTGASIVATATWDELFDSAARYDLSDGINWVQKTVLPANPTIDTELLFKAPIAAGLQTGSDWINEDVRIAPALVSDVVQWLQTPAVTGLWSAAEVSASNDGTTLQLASLTPGTAGALEVQGGTSNAATAAVVGSPNYVVRGGQSNTVVTTVRRAEADGFTGNSYVRIDNTNALAKVPFWNSASTMTSVDVDGLFTMTPALYSVIVNIDETRAQFEKVGKFVAIHIPEGLNDQIPALTDASEDDFIYITAPTLNRSDYEPVASSNSGVFRIVRSRQNNFGITIWIENDNCIEQLAVCKLKTLTHESMVPGDVWKLSTSAFGAGNKGSWNVVEVGAAAPGDEMYVTNNFRVDVASKRTEALGAPVVFGANAELVQHHQGVPSHLFKKIHSILPNLVDPGYVDIEFSTGLGYSKISATAGSVITALDKFDFPLGVNSGANGYNYATGLVAEANRIVYGDPSDEATYPGYAAAGAQILTSAAYVKRIKLALSLRVQSNLASDDLADRVRNAVASVINQGGVGEAIAFSHITGAADDVAGVIASAVVSPTYNSTSDTIPVGAFERPLVLDLKNDIQIAFVGE